MKEISISDVRYRLVVVQGEGRWTAHAERDGTGQRFGIECRGLTEVEAVALLTQWLEWQRDHAAALEGLQSAERAYHRAVTGNAFANRPDGSTPVDLEKERLAAVEAARINLDEVRARKPDC